MPAYPYRCSDPSCDHCFEVVKCIANYDTPETCEKCKAPATRYISRTHFYGASDWDKAEFNPGLGCVTKGAKHRAQIARSRGLEEIGNDSTADKMVDHHDSYRQRRHEQGWANA